MSSTAQVVFTTNSDLKALVMQKVKKSGLTLKAVLNKFMQLYAQDELQLELQVVPTPKREFETVQPTSEDITAWEEAKKDLENGENWHDGDEVFKK
jgi:hypoxanthine phosphoribosyltransferase